LTRQVENIRTEQRFTTAKHKNGTGDGGNLIDDWQFPSRDRRENSISVALARQWMQRRFAAFGQLPENQTRLVLVSVF
jgi:hypothetical protein